MKKYAEVVELVDTLSEGVVSFARAGSSPAFGTILKEFFPSRLNLAAAFAAKVVSTVTLEALNDLVF